METPRRTLILGVASSDAHAVANHLFAMRFRTNGFFVVNLGVCTPLTEFADALDAYPAAEAVLIGSLNGHAYEDLQDLPALRFVGRLHCPIIVGGNLSVGSKKDNSVVKRLHALGVDHVLEDPDELDGLLDRLRREPVSALIGVSDG